MAYRVLQYQKEILEKGKSVPINVVHGEEEYLVRALLDRLRSLYGDNVTVVWGDEIEPEEIYTVLSESSLFSSSTEKAVVVLRAEELLKRLKSRRALTSFTDTLGKLKSTRLYLVFGRKLTSQDLSREPLRSLSASGHLIVADRLSPAKVREIVRKKLEREAGGVEESALNLLVEMCGSNLMILRYEVEKLIAYAGGRKVTEEDVRKVSFPWESYTIFDFIDSFLSGDLEGALRALEDAYRKGVPALQIQSTLASYALKLHTLHRLLERGENVERALDSVGARHSFLRAKLRGYLDTCGRERAKELVESLHRLDLSQKLYFANPERSLRNFVAEFLRG